MGWKTNVTVTVILEISLLRCGRHSGIGDKDTWCPKIRKLNGHPGDGQNGYAQTYSEAVHRLPVYIKRTPLSVVNELRPGEEPFRVYRQFSRFEKFDENQTDANDLLKHSFSDTSFACQLQKCIRLFCPLIFLRDICYSFCLSRWWRFLRVSLWPRMLWLLSLVEWAVCFTGNGIIRKVFS